MEIERLNRETLIYCGSKTYTWSDKELEKLSKTNFTENPNYMRVLRKIPEYFRTNDLFTCMMLAFNYGEMKGRECERDMIKWNASATFSWLKLYHQENGCFPDNEADLRKWEKAYVHELEAKEGVVHA